MTPGATGSTDPVVAIGTGATKAGTSWVFRYLRGHPECHLRSIKELHHFHLRNQAGAGWSRAKLSERRDRHRRDLVNADGDRAASLKPRLADLDDWLATPPGDTAACLSCLHSGRDAALAGESPTLMARVDYAGALRRLSGVPGERLHIGLYETLFTPEGWSALSRFLGIADAPGQFSEVVDATQAADPGKARQARAARAAGRRQRGEGPSGTIARTMEPQCGRRSGRDGPGVAAGSRDEKGGPLRLHDVLTRRRVAAGCRRCPTGSSTRTGREGRRMA